MGRDMGEVTPTPEMIAMAMRIADGTGYQSITLEWRNCYTCALAAIMETTEIAAKVAESAFDERGNGRAGHYSEMDWTDGYRDATRARCHSHPQWGASEMKFGNWVGVETKKTPEQWLRVKDARVGPVLQNGDYISINKSINREIVYRTDRVDHWQSPGETVKLLTGDCEDFAILKRAILLVSGYRDEQIQLVIGYDTLLRANHAVLLVDGYILDCTTDRIITPTEAPHFKPVMAMSGTKTWIMGRSDE